MYFQKSSFAALIVLLVVGSATAAAMPIVPLEAQAAAPAQATTWYVSTAGDDGNDCLSALSPCSTIEGALAKAAAGDTLLIAAGTYVEHLLLDKDVVLQGLDVAGTVIDGNTSGRVLEVPPGVHARVSHLTIAHGFTASPGAGVYISGTLELDHSVISGNSSAYGGSGGGLYNGGTLTMTYSLVQENSASSWGGGLYNVGMAYIENSAIVSNTADSGGGLYNGGTMFLRSGTLSGNWVSNVAALYNQGYISLTNSTIAYNHVSGGTRAGGVLASEMTEARFKNTIVSDNDNVNCEDFGYYSDGYNVDSGASCQFFQPSDQNNTDPLLGPLADNGGPSPTHALSGGPAVDTATNVGCPPTDQRGAPRPVDGGSGSSICDVGAYEYLGVVPPLPSRPDLAVADFIYTAGPTGLLDDPLGSKLELRVSNLGPAATVGSYAIGLYVSPDAEITPQDQLLDLGLVEGPPLAAGQEDVPVTLPDELGLPAGWPTGPAYLGVILDSTGLVAEGDEGNNGAALPIYLLPAGPHSWVVATTADDGQDMRSLRFALDYARPTDTVHFSPTVFPPVAPATIALTAPLTVTQGHMGIDGSGAGVILDGSSLPVGQAALILDSNANQVQGLQVQKAPSGMRILGDDNVIGAESSNECPSTYKVNRPPTAPANLFSGNANYGVEILQGRGNVLLGNSILDNGIGGVWIQGGQENQVGGDWLGEANVIGGNLVVGICLGGGTQANRVYGNYVGTDSSGLEADPNGVGVRVEDGAALNEIGGPGVCQGNMLTANEEWGLVLAAGGNTVAGNLVGAFVQDPPEPLPGTQGGIRVEAGVGNVIGGERGEVTCNMYCNWISGNGDHGILLTGTVSETVVQGNWIGLDRSGTGAQGNARDGIRIDAGADYLIGSAGEPGFYGNLIGGNEGAGLLVDGVEGVVIADNVIGLGTDLFTVVGNEVGIWLTGGTSSSAMRENVVAGNRFHGLYLQGGVTPVLGNTVDSNSFVQNEGIGIWLEQAADNEILNNQVAQNGAQGLVISGTESMYNTVTGNGIEANELSGVLLGDNARDNTLDGNVIRDNASSGVVILSADNQLVRNQIYGNGGHGVWVTGSESTHNTISRNQIYGNAERRIRNTAGGNAELYPPQVTGFRYIGGETPWRLTVSTCYDCKVELFVQSPGASEYVMTKNAWHGSAELDVALPEGARFDLTATDWPGNTSEYAGDLPVDVEITAIEVVQSIQTLDNAVPLYAGKPTYVRVHVRGDQETAPGPVRAHLEATRPDGTFFEIDPDPNVGCPLELFPQPAPDRGELADSFCFPLLVRFWEAGTWTLTASLDVLLGSDPDESNNTLTTTVLLTETDTFGTRILMVSYPENLVDRYEWAGYSGGDQLAVGDIDRDWLDEIVVGHADTHQLEVREHDVNGVDYNLSIMHTIPADESNGFHSGDRLAILDMDNNNFEEVLIADAGRDQLHVWSFDPAAQLWTHQRSLDLPFAPGDSLAVVEGGFYGAQVLIGERSGTIRHYYNTSDGELYLLETLETDHGIEDMAAVRLDTGPYGCKLLVADRQDGNVYIYNLDSLALPYEGELGNPIPANFQSGDRLAIGDIDGYLVGGDTEYPEILVGQKESQGVAIHRWTGQSWEWVALYDGWYDPLVSAYSEGGSVAVGKLYPENGSEQRRELVSGSAVEGHVMVGEKNIKGDWRTLTANDVYKKELLSFLRRMYPIPATFSYPSPLELDVAYGTPDNNKLQATLGALRAEESLESWTYLTIMEGDGRTGGQMRSPRDAFFLMNLDGAHVKHENLVGAAHEIGHTRGLGHTYMDRSLGGSAGRVYPAPEGTITYPGHEPDLRILDVSEPLPASLPLVGASDYFGFFHDVDVQGNYAYVANYAAGELEHGGLAIYDLTDENHPALVGVLSLEDGSDGRVAGGARRVQVSGDYAYLADVYGGLIAVDVSDVQNPVEVDRFELPTYPFAPGESTPVTALTAFAYDVHVNGDTLYVVDYPYKKWAGDRFGGYLRLFDVSDPSDLVLTSVVTPAGWPNGVYAEGNYAYVATDAGMEIYDVSNPYNPILLGQVGVGSDAFDLVVQGNYAYLATSAGLRMVDVSNKLQPALSGFIILGDCRDVASDSTGRAYLACRQNGLQVVDVSNPNSPSLVSTYDPAGTPFVVSGVDVVGDRAYLAAWDAGVYGFDPGDPYLGALPKVYSGYDYMDVMSYRNPQWMSWYSYHRIWNDINQKDEPYPGGSSTMSQGEGLLVSGLVDADAGTGSLSLLRRTLGLALTALPPSSTVRLQLVDGAGATLADYPLPLERYAESSWTEGRQLLLDAAVPYQAGTAHIDLLFEGAVVTSRTVSANPPQVTLLAPNGGEVLGEEVEVRWSAQDADGDDLGFMLLVSADGGASWLAVASDLGGSSYTLDTGYLRGSNDTRFRIVADDGVNTAFDDSDGPITMPTRPPEVEILSPPHAGRYELQQTIFFWGQAQDPDRRDIPEEGYTWSSDLDGVLGTGSGLYVDGLSAGRHTITLAVTDADGETAEDSIVIMVDRELYRVMLPLVLRSYQPGDMP